MYKKTIFPISCIAIYCLFLIGCNSQQEVEPTATEAPPTPTNTATALPTNTPTATPTLPPTATPTPAPLSPTEIFELLSPHVAFIETPLGSGSGVLFAEGYLLTNAHVIWPYESVRVVFPDGSEFLEAPVFNVDLMSDLAVIGPIDKDLEPVLLVNGEDQVIGSDVYLLGYPGEVEQFPQPTITRGLISRLREWEKLDITFFQSDAAIAGGQSGGILVSEMGDVIGISGFRFSEAGFALVASAADIEARAQSLLAGEDISELGDWRLPKTDLQKSTSIILGSDWITRAFVFNEPVGTNIEIELTGEEAYFSFMDAYGREMTWGNATDSLAGSIVIETEGPHFLLVYQNVPYRNTFNLKSSHEFSKLSEIDGEVLRVGKSVPGWLNFPGDIDVFQVYLEAGERVNIQVDSALIDPYFSIFPDDFGYSWRRHSISDDDSGGGVFGLNAELTYEAPENAFYNIIVESALGYEIGGYTLTLSEPYTGAPTPIAPTATPKPFETEVGSMKIYENATYDFSFAYPGNWEEVLPGMPWYDLCQDVDVCFSHFLEDAIVFTFVEDLSNLDLDDLTMEEYIDFINEAAADELTIFGQEEFETQSGLTVTIIEMDILGLLKAKRLIYQHNGAWINITYLAGADYYEDMLPIIEYSFESFTTD